MTPDPTQLPDGQTWCERCGCRRAELRFKLCGPCLRLVGMGLDPLGDSTKPDHALERMEKMPTLSGWLRGRFRGRRS